MNAILRRRRRWLPIWLLINVSFMLAVSVAAVVGKSESPRVVYLVLLFALCSSSLLGSGALNGRNAILIACGGFFFIFYGLADVLRLFPALELAPPYQSMPLVSLPEVAILVGVALISVGYRLIAGFGGSKARPLAANEWPHGTAVALGLALWIVGAAATWYWAMHVVDRYIEMAQIGPYQTIALLVGRMVQPVGVALLAYRLVISRSKPLFLLVLAILAAEFVLGFLADSKELAIRGAILVMAAKFLVEGRLPRSWLIVSMIAIALSFAIFQAYRFEILQTRHKTRTAAAANLSRNLDRTLSSNMLAAGYALSGVRAFVERTSLKPTMEIVVAHVGDDVPYQNGDTLLKLFYAFVPRILWPDKPDNAVGQLFNRQFHLSWDPNTYVSATQLGELYWNLGWPALLVGSLAIGAVLGFVGGRCALADHRSLTRFLVVSTTIYLLAARFEGGIALTYTVWIRSVLLILALHFVFGRVRTAPRPHASPALA